MYILHHTNTVQPLGDSAGRTDAGVLGANADFRVDVAMVIDADEALNAFRALLLTHRWTQLRRLTP